MPGIEKLNREILKWARKSAKISLQKAAAKISKTCKPERIRDWETPGAKDTPTIKQLEKLARLYRRPADVFFMPYIPPDYPLLKDFRSNKEEGMDTALIFLMRELQEKQDWLSRFLKSRKEKKLDFVGRFTIKSAVEDVATDIRKTLGIRSSKPGEKPLKHWIERAEENGIFVALSSNFHSRLKLDSDHVKGFIACDKFAPFIFINSDAWDEEQLFTLVHLLVHVWINVPGIVNDTGISENTPAGLHVVEKFCRLVAEEALLPQKELAKFIQNKKGETEFRQIATASRRLGAGHHDIIYRCIRLNLFNEKRSGQLLEVADETRKEFLYKLSIKPKSSGGPNYYVMALRRSSKAFSGLVMDAYKSGKLKGDKAGKLLNVKESNFIKFEKFIYGK